MLPKLACLLAPVFLAVEVDVGSQVFAAELLIPSLALLCFAKGKGDRLSREFSAVVRIGIAYFVAQIFSDIWNETSFEQYSRGWARIVLFLINLVSIYILIDNKRSHLILFSLGFAVGRIWATLSGFDGDSIPWKIGLAKPVALALVLLCCVVPAFRGSRAYLSAAVLGGLGVFDITMDFRSHGVVLIVVAVLLSCTHLLRQQAAAHGNKRLGSFLSISVAGIAAAFVTFQIYVYAAESGWLSEGASRKYQSQVVETEAPLLVAGRSEVLIYLEVISDSIIFGHGSWPRDQSFAERLQAKRYEWGLSDRMGGSTDDSIPLHSHFFGGWIEAGILGGVFWGSVILLAVRSLMLSGAGTSHMRPLYLYGAILLLWDVLFSPFSGFRRLETAFYIVIVLRSLLQRQPMVAMQIKRFRRRRRAQSSNKKRRGKFGAGESWQPLRRRVLGLV